MLKKIEMGKIDTRSQVTAYIRELERMVIEYGWGDKAVYPYSNCPVTLNKAIRDMKDYDKCTRGSQEYLVAFANGLADILNHWEADELKPHVTVRMINTGEVRSIPEDWLDIFGDIVEIIA